MSFSTQLGMLHSTVITPFVKRLGLSQLKSKSNVIFDKIKKVAFDCNYTICETIRIAAFDSDSNVIFDIIKMLYSTGITSFQTIKIVAFDSDSNVIFDIINTVAFDWNYFIFETIMIFAI